MNYIDFMKTGGIHIKKENRGKFTDYCEGKVTAECIQRGKNSPSATIRKRATFAQWSKREEGGILHAQTGAKVNLSYQTLPKKIEDPEEIKLQNPEEESTETTASETPQPEEANWWETKAQEYLSQTSSPDNTTQNNPSVNPSQSTASSTQTQFSADLTDRTQQVMTYLMSKGFNKEAAAGITGVFIAESGLKPGILNQDESNKYGSSAGKGLGQWSNSRRKQYDDFTKGKVSGIQTDLDFFIYDLESRPLVKQALASATSVEDAVRAMHLGYENGSSRAMATPDQLTQTYSRAWSRLGYRPYSYADSHNKRFNYAQTAYQSI